MSYIIYIGEATIESPDLSEPDEGTPLGIVVNGLELEEAPLFPGDPTGRTNRRHPGYSQWADFLREVGLYELFMDKEVGIMASHPGCFQLIPEHLQKIREALSKWNQSHPNTIAGWSEEDALQEASILFDGGKARLMWLEWWVSWALNNCAIPAIYNF